MIKKKKKKIGKVYSFEYTEIPKVFLCHVTGFNVSMETKGITDAAVVLKATVIQLV
jgi:hypothetical protein